MFRDRRVPRRRLAAALVALLVASGCTTPTPQQADSHGTGVADASSSLSTAAPTSHTELAPTPLPVNSAAPTTAAPATLTFVTRQATTGTFVVPVISGIPFSAGMHCHLDASGLTIPDREPSVSADGLQCVGLGLSGGVAGKQLTASLLDQNGIVLISGTTTLAGTAAVGPAGGPPAATPLPKPSITVDKDHVRMDEYYTITVYGFAPGTTAQMTFGAAGDLLRPAPFTFVGSPGIFSTSFLGQHADVWKFGQPYVHTFSFADGTVLSVSVTVTR